jgi:hypothetical protein
MTLPNAFAISERLTLPALYVFTPELTEDGPEDQPED